MYFLPGWDVEIFKQIQQFKKQKIDKFTISSCLIEPLGANSEYTIRNHGHTSDMFNEKSLLSDYFTNSQRYAKINTTQYSHPITMSKTLWDAMGGVDTSYQYGIATDHDIAASAYKEGCRNFIMLGKSRVYHFVSQTVRKLPKDREDGHVRFRNKWGKTIDEFRERIGIAKPYVKVPNNVFTLE